MAYSGKLYQLTDIQRLDGEKMLNVFFYKDDTGTGTADDLRLAYKDRVQLQMLDVQSADLQHVGISVINLFDESDFSTDSDVRTGTIGIEAMPHAVAVNFTLRPNSRAVRPGSKRIAGPPESAGNHNVINNPTYIGNLNGLVTQFAANIDAPISPVSSYDPAIVKRIPYITPEGKPAYRLPANASEANVFLVIAALVSLTFSHQVSRG
jgi:hypothetical protein